MWAAKNLYRGMIGMDNEKDEDMTKKELEYELGRYKKKVADQQREICVLKEQLEARDTTVAMSEAFLAMVLSQCGRVVENPLRVTTREIAEAVTHRFQPLFRQLDTGEFLMWVQ